MVDDSAAFQRELVLLLPRLRRFALALTKNREAAEDLLQSTVERALRKWDSFEKGRRMDSWTFKIMQNCWFDTRRSASAGMKFSDETVDVVGEDGRAVVESREEFARAREAFAALPDEQRAVLALVVLDGLSYAAAADALQIPIGTVMSRLARARASLVARVRAEPAFEPAPKDG